METWVKKRQEMLHKELEELKDSDEQHNNWKKQKKNTQKTLEGINSRITEAEEWKTVPGNRMAEITATEQNKEK